MSALAEALLAAQRQAIGAMMKAHTQLYDGEPDEEAFYGLLDSIGCGDKTDSVHLWAALNIIRQTGAQTPGTPNGAPAPKEAKPASDAQWKLLRRLADERSVPAPEGPLTVEQASKVIEELKAGTYNADAWSIPF